MAKKVTNGLVETAEEVIVFDAIILQEETVEVPVVREDPGNKTRAFRG